MSCFPSVRGTPFWVKQKLMLDRGIYQSWRIDRPRNVQVVLTGQRSNLAVRGFAILGESFGNHLRVQGCEGAGLVDLLPRPCRVHTQGLLRVLLTTPTAVEWRLGKCARKFDGVGGRRERDDCYKVEKHDKLRLVGSLKKECGADLAAWAIKNAI